MVASKQDVVMALNRDAEFATIAGQGQWFVRINKNECQTVICESGAASMSSMWMRGNQVLSTPPKKSENRHQDCDYRCKCLLMFDGSHCQLTTQGFSGGFVSTISALPQEDLCFTLLWEDMPLSSLKKMFTLPSLKRICPLSSLKRIYPLPSIGIVCPLPSNKRIYFQPFKKIICLLPYLKRICSLPFIGISMRRIWGITRMSVLKDGNWHHLYIMTL